MSASGFRFTPWLVGFFLALIAIPYLIYAQFFGLAKVLGIAVTVALVVVLRIWLYRLKKQGAKERYAFTTNDAYDLHALVPACKSLSSEDLKSLQHRLGLIMGAMTVQNPHQLAIETSAKQLAISGALYAFMHVENPKEIQWIIRDEPSKIEGNQMVLGLGELHEYLNKLNPKTISVRL